jgi:transposase
LPLAEEAKFLEPWAERAESGGVLVVPPIHRALEECVGHPVAATTVYRMLARHGWRKVEPEPHHPNRDPEAQEAFKKTGRRCWRRAAR